MESLAIFIGGGLGSLVRFQISKAFASVSTGFPYGTLLANILACLVLGLGWKYFEQHTNFPPAYKLGILVGFCGGFSTFSTFSLETLRMLQNHQILSAALYVILSIVLCILTLLIALNQASS